MEFKLGKQEYKHDDRTLKLATYFVPEIVAPAKHNVDAGKRSFPTSAFGNEEYGNCVKVGQTNQLLRFERIEQRRTLPITTELVVKEYAEESYRQFGCRVESSGDQCDQGLYVLDNLKNWRNVGWPLDFTKTRDDARTYKISAYGELEPGDNNQLRLGIYLLTGIQLGLWLPISAQEQTEQGYWDVVEGPEGKAGSWGGHAVYAYAYDEGNLFVKSWGLNVRVTNAFIQKYCDEAWAVVDSLDSWRVRQSIDVESLLKHLHDIGSQPQS